jgi:DNA-binding transcriptional MerR regulator
MAKSAEAFRTISEVADWLGVQTHVLRFWESKFTQVKPVKRAGGRRYYRPNDMALLSGIRVLLHDDGVTIRGVQKILREKGIKHVVGLSDRPLAGSEDVDNATDETTAVSAKESKKAKVIPMQPPGNVSNLFGNSDTQPVEEEPKTDDPEPLSLFSHRAEPEVSPVAEETPVDPEPIAEAEPEEAVDNTVPSFSRAVPDTSVKSDQPPVDAAPDPEPETPALPAVEMPAASPVTGPALAAAAAAAARLSTESIISRADRLAPAARRLQELHTRMSGKAG